MCTVNWEIFVSPKFRIWNFCVQIFQIPAYLLKIIGTEKFPVFNFLLKRGITGRPSKLNFLQRNCEDYHAFVFAVHKSIWNPVV